MCIVFGGFLYIWNKTMSYVVTPLPIADLEQIETRATLKKAALAHRYLAELKGIAETIPTKQF